MCFAWTSVVTSPPQNVIDCIQSRFSFYPQICICSYNRKLAKSRENVCGSGCLLTRPIIGLKNDRRYCACRGTRKVTYLHSSGECRTRRMRWWRMRDSVMASRRRMSVTISRRFGLCSLSATLFSNMNTDASCQPNRLPRQSQRHTHSAYRLTTHDGRCWTDNAE